MAEPRAQSGGRDSPVATPAARKKPGAAAVHSWLWPTHADASWLEHPAAWGTHSLQTSETASPVRSVR